MFLPSSVLAFSNPQIYYDWNRYGVERVLGFRVYGQELATPSGQVVEEDYKNYKEHDYVLGFVAETKPGDAMYFLKKVEETVSLALTFDKQKKEKVRFEFAGESQA